jgi:hypothetical protein
LTDHQAFLVHSQYFVYSLNKSHRGGKRNTMVMMFVGGVVLMVDA